MLVISKSPNHYPPCYSSNRRLVIFYPPLRIQFTKGGIEIKTYYSSSKLIRYVVAYVFITSGLMKLISEELAHSFINLGLPYPHILLNVVALLEIICGILLLANRSVKNASIPLLGIMIAALLLTKLPTINTGFLQFAFNARLDIVMILLLIILYTKSPN
jgi:putative oxidoreductase